MVEYLILNIWSKNKVNVKNNRPVIFLLFSYLKNIAEAQFWENEFQLFMWSYQRRQKYSIMFKIIMGFVHYF